LSALIPSTSADGTAAAVLAAVEEGKKGIALVTKLVIWEETE